jgi:hypothetical protein
MMAIPLMILNATNKKHPVVQEKQIQTVFTKTSA